MKFQGFGERSGQNKWTVIINFTVKINFTLVRNKHTLMFRASLHE